MTITRYYYIFPASAKKKKISNSKIKPILAFKICKLTSLEYFELPNTIDLVRVGVRFSDVFRGQRKGILEIKRLKYCLNISNFVQKSVSFSKKIKIVEEKGHALSTLSHRKKANSMYVGNYFQTYVHEVTSAQVINLLDIKYPLGYSR